MTDPVHGRRAAARRRMLAATVVILAACNAISGVDDLSFDGAAPCETALDCQDENPCNVSSCGDDGACAASPLPDGPAPTQVPGDCLHAICDAGQAIQESDPTDVDDGNPCTADACNREVATHDPLDGVACLLGEAAGVCVDGTCVVKCETSEDCNDGAPCTIDSCNVSAQQCTYEGNHGALVDNSSSTDCVQIVCNGSLEAVVPKDDEVPDDDNECTADECAGGAPKNTPLPGKECMAGACNDRGQCVGCQVPADCGGVDTECAHHTCVGGVCGVTFEPMGSPGSPPLPQAPGDCVEVVCDGQGGTLVQPQDSDFPLDDGNPCTTAACSGGTPSFPPAPLDTPCPAGFCSATGLCVECNVPSQCGVPGSCKVSACSANTCGSTNTAAGTDPSGDCADQGGASCGTSGTCDGNGACSLYPSGTVCAPPTCGGNPPTQTSMGTCNGSGTCTSGMSTPCFPYICGAGACKTSCSGNSECQAPFSSCSSGVCKKPNGSACSLGSECATNLCVDGYCCNSACGTACYDCNVSGSLGTCTPVAFGADDGTCTGAAVSCSGSGTCKSENGQNCMNDSQCLSTFCVDGFCCNTSCTATCKACTASKTASANGTCANIDNGTDPDGECSGFDPICCNGMCSPSCP